MVGMDDFGAAIVRRVSRLSLGLRIFSKSSCDRISQRLFSAGLWEEDAQAYLSGAALASFIASIVLLAASSAFLPIGESIAASFLLFALSFSALFSLPGLLAGRRSALAESEMPFLLREAAIYLDIGLPFEKAIAKLGTRGYALSPDFLRASQEIKSGSTVPSALLSMSGRIRSPSIKRCLMMFSSIYETGAGSEPLKRTAEELAASQISSMRLQSGRLSLLSILFICCSALLPSFFTVLCAVWPSVSDGPVADWQVWLSFLVLFPVLNIAALVAVLLLLPPSSQHGGSGSGMLEQFLRKSGFPHGSRAFSIIIAACSIAFFAIFFLAGSLALAALCLCIAPAAYSLVSYFASREVDEAELRLPDALYAAASTHRLLSAEKMLSFLANGGFGRLSEAFALALRRQKAGDSFSSSMAAAAAHCPSQLVERAFSLLVVSYETGANMYFALREAAQDVVSFFTLVRERASQLAIQRYTMLGASALLVPLILGTVVSLVPALSSSQLGGGGQGSGSLSSALSLACPAYLAINCLLSSLLLAASETSPRRAALYFALAAPVSQLVFALSSSGSPLSQ